MLTTLAIVHRRVVLAVALFVVTAGTTVAAPHYSVVGLNAAGVDYSFPYALNDNSQAAGAYVKSQTTYHAFLYNNGVKQFRHLILVPLRSNNKIERHAAWIAVWAG